MAQRQTVGFWQEQLDGWRRSGLTQVGYCASRGLNIKSFQRWRCKEKKTAASTQPSLTLIPVSVGAPVMGGTVCLHSPGGWRLELPATSAPWLADLLRQLP